MIDPETGEQIKWEARAGEVWTNIIHLLDLLNSSAFTPGEEFCMELGEAILLYGKYKFTAGYEARSPRMDIPTEPDPPLGLWASEV